MKKTKKNKQLLIALLTAAAVLCITVVGVLALESAIKKNKAADISEPEHSTSIKNDDTAGIDIYDGDDVELSSDTESIQKSEEAESADEKNAQETITQEELPDDYNSTPVIPQNVQPTADSSAGDDGSIPVMTDTPLGEDEMPDIE